MGDVTHVRRIAVAATGQQAVDAGLAVAADGGNAVDAALATAFVALATEPGMVSLGGGAYVSVWPAGGDPVVVDGNVEMPGTISVAPTQPKMRRTGPNRAWAIASWCHPWSNTIIPRPSRACSNCHT